MRHVAAYSTPLVQYLANSSSRDAKQSRELVLRQSRCRQNILAQNFPGMRRSSLSIVQPIVRHRSNPLVVIFKVNVEGVFTFKRKRHAPVSADRNAPGARAIALQLVQAVAWQIQISRRARAIENV